MIAAIWDDVIVTDDSLIHAISVLRRALGDERHRSRYIRTLPRRGYRFVAELHPPDPLPSAPAAAPAAAGADTPTLPAPAATLAGRPAFAATGRLLGAAGAVVLAVLAAAFLIFGRGSEPPSAAAASVRLFQPAPPDASIVSGGVLSPDGRYLAFIARDDAAGTTALWLRALQTEELRRLAGTDGASKPFWSPDSRRIGFFTGGELLTIDIGDGSRRAIAMVFAAAGGTWSTDDTILFAEWSNGLYAVPASGDGTVRAVAVLDRDAGDIAYAWPQFFPDAQQFLYQIVSLDQARSGIYVGNLASDRRFKLLDTTSSATLAPPHHVLHVANDMLIAEELDPLRPELTGRAIVIARGVSAPSLAAENIVSASADLIAFQHGIVRQNLAWYGRDGERLGDLPIPTGLYNPRLSADGHFLIGSSALTTDPGLWLVRLDREETTRLETDAMAPVFSPDSRRLAFASRNGFSLFVRNVDGGDGKRLVASGSTVMIPNDWSPDGRLLVFTQQGMRTGLDLWTVDTETGETKTLLATTHGETQARISPDGRWIAYASDESGTLETYVARFPGMDATQQVSVGGGGQPQWRADQTELYYLAADRALMAVRVDAKSAAPFGPPRRLLRAPIAGDPGDGRDFFAATADGSRFLIDSATSGNDGEAITIMVNWAAGMPEQQIASARIEPAGP